jgi:hypothetical protein
MKKSMTTLNEIRNNVTHNKYLYLLASAGIFIPLVFFKEFNYYIFLLTVVLFGLAMLFNEITSEENGGLIAVAQMILIVLMIGFGDYFSSNGNRLINLANFFSPLFFTLSGYGFYLSRKN